MQFSNIIGQQSLKQQLIQSVANKRVPHAIMLLGQEGSGHLSLAVAFAQYLNCERKVVGQATNNGGESVTDSCGECPSCIKSQKLIHPDIHFTYPVISTKNGKSVTKPKSADFIEEWRKYFFENPYLNIQDWVESLDAENKQGNISVEECHEIIRSLNFKTFESTYKVYIIWMPELLGKEGNVLLKSLEEPPENTIFILVADNQEQILNTILSRVQMMKVPRLKDEEIIFQLETKHNVGNKEAHSIARRVDGNFNEALKLSKNTEDDNEKLYLLFLRICLKGSHEGKSLIDFCDEVNTLGRENLKGLLRYGLDLMREIFVLEHIGESKARLSENELKLAVYINQRLAFNSKEEIIKKLEESCFHLERNANPKILFMNLGIFMSHLLKRNELVLT